MPLLEPDCYSAFIRRDKAFDGVFYVGVVTTGIFCRPSCKARKAKFENCRFFADAQLCQNSGFRPCLRCEPLTAATGWGNSKVFGLALAQSKDPALNASASPGTFQKLLALSATEPDRRWQDKDLRAMGYQPASIRRLFKKHLGITFIEYCRRQRLQLAYELLQQGASAGEAQALAEYKSASAFRRAISKFSNS